MDADDLIAEARQMADDILSVRTTPLSRIELAAMLGLAMKHAECKVEGCGRVVRARGLCPGHYEQHRAKEPLTPLRTARGEGDRVTVSMASELRQRAAAAAERAGETEGEWWRRAGEQRLERDEK